MHLATGDRPADSLGHQKNQHKRSSRDKLLKKNAKKTWLSQRCENRCCWSILLFHLSLSTLITWCDIQPGIWNSTSLVTHQPEARGSNLTPTFCSGYPHPSIYLQIHTLLANPRLTLQESYNNSHHNGSSADQTFAFLVDSSFHWWRL